MIPLGGLGNIGRNMTAFEINGQILLVDCGVLFPEDDQPGVDLILPGLDYLEDRMDDIGALVLTHGHEDHIGAVPYLLRRRNDIALIGSRLTLGLLAAKLREHRIADPQLQLVSEGDEVSIGAFDLEFLAVNHSIPDALAVVLRTAAGTVLHTGDFKLDQLPLDGRVTDMAGFAAIGDEGVDLLLVDSTNADIKGFTPLERDIQPNIERVFAGARKKIVVACFASHIHRVQQVLDVAHQYGRKVIYIGRSMVRNMSIAGDLGFLKVPPNTIIDLKSIENYRDDEIVVISTGSQGEPLSALARMANREHPAIRIAAGDTVLLASSLIPGNENAVFRVINGLVRLGAEVVHKGSAMVHVSGHAAAGELLTVFNMVKPANVMPVHGEPRHLVAAGQLAEATGVPADQVLLCEDGDVIDLIDGVARVSGRVDASFIFVDGTTVGDVSDSSLTDRRILGEEGFISIVAAVDLRSGSVVAGPDISARGFLEAEDVFDRVQVDVKNALEAAIDEGVDDVHRLQQIIRRTVGRWVSSSLRRRPMIVPVVIAI